MANKNPYFPKNKNLSTVIIFEAKKDTGGKM